MEWFKFYHNKWLTDRAINNLRPQDRLCFITLLCVTSQSDERNGIVTNYCEHEIIKLTQLDINVYDDEKSDYHRAIGFTKRLADSGIIEIQNDKQILIKNFTKRQDTMLSPAERAKKYRDKKKVTNVTNKSDDSNAREEKSRVDKKREEREEASLSFLENLPTTTKEELSLKYNISQKGIQSKSTDLFLYCKQKGKKYKDYKSFLENALRKDKIKLQNEYPLVNLVVVTEKEEILTPEQVESNQRRIEEIALNLRNKFKMVK